MCYIPSLVVSLYVSDYVVWFVGGDGWDYYPVFVVDRPHLYRFGLGGLAFVVNTDFSVPRFL